MFSTPRIASVVFLAYLLISACTGTALEPVPQQTASAVDRELLNSERIRRDFGSYGIEVIRQNIFLRVSNLYSVHQGQKTTRTLAVVFYPDVIPAAIRSEHEEIVAGGSIGEVFKNRGWVIDKSSVYIGEMDSSELYDGVYAAMGGIEATELAIHLYRLSVNKNGAIWNYANIAEIYHPDYLDLETLEEIYPEQLQGSRKTQHEIDFTLERVSRVMGYY